MTELATWVDSWMESRSLPRGIDPSGRIIGSVETDAGGTTVREVRAAVTDGEPRLLVLQVHSADRIAHRHAPQVYAACNRWNASQRVPRAWVSGDEATLKVVIETSIPEAALDADCVRRVGDLTVDAAVGFWRWADLKTEW